MKRTYQPSKLVRKRRHGIPRAYGHQRRPQGAGATPRTRPQKTFRVSNRAKKPLNRLRKRAEFLAVASSGRKWVTGGLILQVRSAPACVSVRYGLTASGKIGNAVKRNRARRRLRVLADEVLQRHAASGHDYVLIARASTITRAFADLRGDLTAALKKLGVWQDR